MSAARAQALPGEQVRLTTDPSAEPFWAAAREEWASIPSSSTTRESAPRCRSTGEPRPRLASARRMLRDATRLLGSDLVRVALPALLQRFPRLQLATEQSQLTFRGDGPVNGIRSLPVAW